MTITKGLLTYEAEGTEGGRFHSRKLHVPPENSGLTIGRGYDLKRRKSSEIKTDLCAAGVSHAHATLLAGAAKLNGVNAEKFIGDNNLKTFEISIDTQEKLFITLYEEMAINVKRAFNKVDCVKTYGKVDWEKLDITIKDVVIDLQYRGDYTPASRKLIQPLIVNNDLNGMGRILSIRSLWAYVPEDRFRKRADFLSEAINKLNVTENTKDEKNLPDVKAQYSKFYSKIKLCILKILNINFSR